MGQNVLQETVTLLFIGLSSGGEKNFSYIKPLAGMGFLRHSDLTLAFTLQPKFTCFYCSPEECVCNSQYDGQHFGVL